MLPTLLCLEKESNEASEVWEIRYILLLWLSLICQAPFDLDSIDSVAQTAENSITNRCIVLCRRYLQDGGVVREGAVELMSRLVTRPDVLPAHLPNAMAWAGDSLQAPGDLLPTGCYKFLVAVFQRAKRQELLPHIPTLLQIVYSSTPRSMLLRKYRIKLLRLVGLTLLQPIVAGSPSLDFQPGATNETHER